MLEVIRWLRGRASEWKRPGPGAPSPLPVRRLLERRQVVLAAVGLASAGVFVLQQHTHDPTDAVGLLYVIPIALVALELGLLPGVVGALAAIAITFTWRASVHARLDPVSIITWSVAFLAVGGIGGWFSDRMRAGQHRQRLLLESGLALMRLHDERRQVVELAEQARRILSADAVRVHPIGAAPAAAPPARREQRLALQAGDTCQGTLVVERSRPLSADDRMAVSILAWQSAVAAENARLLEAERERAVIRNELHHARLHLDDRAAQLRELIDRLEAERTHVAYELHEQAAQMLAGVLLDLGALDRRLKTSAIDADLEQLRSDIGSTMSSLRTLAVGLKPSALALGLPTALEELVRTQNEARSRTVEVTGADELDPETTLLLYRTVEEALQAVPHAERISITTAAQAEGPELAIELHAPPDRVKSERLAILRARIDLLAGELTVSAARLRAVLPLTDRSRARGEMERLQPSGPEASLLEAAPELS